jgi:hypothetical protein
MATFDPWQALGETGPPAKPANLLKLDVPSSPAPANFSRLATLAALPTSTEPEDTRGTAALFDLGVRRLGADYHPSGHFGKSKREQAGARKKERSAAASRLFCALRERGVELEVETTSRLLVRLSGSLTPADLKDVDEYRHELAAMAAVMMTRTRAAAFTERMESKCGCPVDSDWGARSLKFLVVCRRHGCIASAKTAELAQQYVDDHRTIDRCSTEVAVHGSEQDAGKQETITEQTGESGEDYWNERR